VIQEPAALLKKKKKKKIFFPKTPVNPKRKIKEKNKIYAINSKRYC
jgi:hypothetical protein